MNQPLFSILKNTPLQIQPNTLSHTFVFCGQEQSGKSTIVLYNLNVDQQNMLNSDLTLIRTNIHLS